jgi:hypothetical protein
LRITLSDNHLFVASVRLRIAFVARCASRNADASGSVRGKPNAREQA